MEDKSPPRAASAEAEAHRHTAHTATNLKALLIDARQSSAPKLDLIFGVQGCFAKTREFQGGAQEKALGGLRRRNARFPVAGSGRKAPPVAGGRVQADADGPVLAALAWRQDAGDPGGGGLATGQVIDADAGTWFEGPGGTYAAAARIYQQGMTELRKRLAWIEAGHPQGDLRADSRSLAALHPRFF